MGGCEAVDFAGKPAWHGLGATVEKGMTSEDALRLAQLDWEVVQRPIFTMYTYGGDLDTVPGYMVNCRSDNGNSLGVVGGSNYEIMQNRDMFAMMDSLEKDGIVKYESAFSLRGGRRVCVLVRLPELPDIGTDERPDRLAQCLLWTTGHDGAKVMTITPTSLRVACANTLRIALSQEQSRALRIIHDRNANANVRIKAAVAAIEAAKSTFAGWTEQAWKVARTEIHEADRREIWWHAICGGITNNNELPANLPNRTRTRIENSLLAIASYWRYNDTAWSAFNAVTAWADHEGTWKSPEHRFLATQDGVRDQIKQRGWRKTLEVCSCPPFDAPAGWRGRAAHAPDLA